MAPIRLLASSLATIAVACSDTGGAAPDAAVADPDAAAPLDAPGSPCPAPALVDVAAAAEVLVAGDPGSAMGIFDPSLVYPSGAPGGAMSYSSVPDQESIRTRIALSADAGATWTFVVEANQPEAATLPSSDAVECPGGACTGQLISEVSSLIIDPDNPDPQRRWKLFAHRYLVGAGVALHYRIGTIALQTAPAPEGPWTAPAKLIGWSSPSPYSSEGAVVNASGLAGTADCLALTEPGALWRPGALDLAVGCVYLDGGTPRIRIELLRSLDHAASWSSIGTLLEADDAACLDDSAAPSINAAGLFFADGVEYAVATPSTATGYTGCLLFPVDDPIAGEVRRDGLGRAVPSLVVAPSPARFAGACDHAEGASAVGLAMVAGFFESERRFRIVRASVTP